MLNLRGLSKNDIMQLLYDLLTINIISSWAERIAKLKGPQFVNA